MKTNSSAVQQFSSSVVQQFSCSAVQLFNSSAVQQFSSSGVQQFSCSAVQLFNSSAVHSSVVQLCSDCNNIRHMIRNYVALCDKKQQVVSEGTTSNVEIARDHYSNNNNITEKQTYGMFFSSLTFTQTRPYTYRTECSIRLPCTIIIIFINCNLVISRWQWLYYMYRNMGTEKK